MDSQDERRWKHEVLSKLDEILLHQKTLTGKVDKLMALADDIKKAIADLDKETTDIATVQAALVAKIKNGMSDQEVADIKASFGTLGDRLKSLGVDPTNPVPPAPPALQELRKKA